MNRTALHLLAVMLAAASAAAAPLSSEQREQSIRYVLGLQNEDGAFRAGGLSGPSSLGATNSALRALKYFKGASQGRAGRFLLGCAHESGGFSDAPGGTPDVRSTAMGLMASVELRSRLSADASGTIREYFEKNARTLPDIYIAVAALDAAGLKSAKAAEWIAEFRKSRNADGTFGSGPAENAGAAISILRLGGTLDGAEAVAAALKAAQRPDGGFSAAGGASDLPTTYRVVRALWMLKQKPDLARLRSFVGRCRDSGGGYAAAPGQAPGVSPTYFAAIVLHWADEMEK